MDSKNGAWLAMLLQTSLLKTQFETIAKAKAAAFRSHCLTRADKYGIDRVNVPMPKEIEQWLLGYEPKLEIARKRLYLPCDYTSERIAIKDIQIDHRIPISRDGSFGIENLAITSAKVNQHKGELLDSEFEQLLGLLDTFEPIGRENVLSRLRRGFFKPMQIKNRR